MKSEMKILSLLFVVLLSLPGCQTLTAGKTQRTPPPTAMQQCDSATKLTDPSLAGVALKLGEVAELNNQCRTRHSDLIEWVQKVHKK